MPRPIWTGSIAFGLVNIPVKLFSAISPKEVHFHMLHDKDGARIKQKRVCSLDDEEVPYEHIVKGHEVDAGNYVTITREELDALDPKATRTIDIEDFVDLEQIDPIFYETSYYLVPDRSAKAYALLLEAMKKTGKVGVARFVMRTKQYLCAVRPMENVLTLSTMLYADEVVPKENIEVEKLPSPAQKELAMAEQLIGSLTGKFQPEKYKDIYREKVLELLEKKAQGEQIQAAPAPQKPGKVIDLMDALKRSLQAREEVRGERRHPAKAARTARSKSPGRAKTKGKKHSA
jgi:DNA end-binding protein Ku